MENPQNKVYYKVRIVSEVQAFEVLEIRSGMNLSLPKVRLLAESPTFTLLARLSERFTETFMNPHDSGWTFILLGSSEDSAVNKLVQLFPEMIEKQFPTDEEAGKLGVKKKSTDD